MLTVRKVLIDAYIAAIERIEITHERIFNLTNFRIEN